MWERWYEAILEEDKLQGSKDITVQCVDFCEAMTSKVHAVLQHAPFDLRGGTFRQHPRVLVATVDYQEKPHLCMQILHAAMFQVSRGAYILLRLLAVTENQETQWLLDEIQRQPSVFVLSGPATVITSIATASAFIADGWSTKSVSRVVRRGRTRQENNERERAEHAYYSHIHDEVTMSQDSDFGKMKISQKTQLHRMTRKMKQNSPYPTHCRHDDKISRIHENVGHPSNRTLVWVLRLGGAKRRFTLAAAKHSCGACEAQKRPAGPNVSRSRHSFVFNDVVGLDLFFLNTFEKHTLPAMNIVCWCTGLQRVFPLRDQSGETLRNLCRNYWLQSYGRPRILVVDQQRS